VYFERIWRSGDRRSAIAIERSDYRDVGHRAIGDRAIADRAIGLSACQRGGKEV
jgi:hypothetical protein